MVRFWAGSSTTRLLTVFFAVFFGQHADLILILCVFAGQLADLVIFLVQFLLQTAQFGRGVMGTADPEGKCSEKQDSKNSIRIWFHIHLQKVSLGVDG